MIARFAGLLPHRSDYAGFGGLWQADLVAGVKGVWSAISGR